MQASEKDMLEMRKWETRVYRKKWAVMEDWSGRKGSQWEMVNSERVMEKTKSERKNQEVKEMTDVEGKTGCEQKRLEEKEKIGKRRKQRKWRDRQVEEKADFWYLIFIYICYGKQKDIGMKETPYEYVKNTDSNNYCMFDV